MGALLFIIIAAAFILLARLFGAWMLRINELIAGLREIIKILKEREKSDLHRNN